MKPLLDYDRDLARRQEEVARTSDMVMQRERVRGALQLRPGERVLEVGCGNGILASEMASAVGGEGGVSGVDISPAMVAMARSFCEAAPHVEFSIADAADLPFPDDSFDAVTAVQCLCLVADATAAIAEMFRVLRPGGRAVILDTDWDTLVWNCSAPELMAKVMGVYASVYTDARLPRTISRLLRSAGFRLIGREQFAILNWSYEPDTYSGHQIGFTRRTAAGFVSPAELNAWEESIRAAAARDEYFFSLNRYIFKALKPA